MKLMNSTILKWNTLNTSIDIEHQIFRVAQLFLYMYTVHALLNTSVVFVENYSSNQWIFHGQFQLMNIPQMNSSLCSTQAVFMGMNSHILYKAREKNSYILLGLQNLVWNTKYCSNHIYRCHKCLTSSLILWSIFMFRCVLLFMNWL